MKTAFILILTLGFSLSAFAQQIGAGAQPLSESRLGVEAGGYVSRGAGTGALVRYLHTVQEGTALELGAGGATGVHGARAFGGIRQRLAGEDVSFPGIYLRAGFESYKDEEGVRRNAVGPGLLFSQGFVLNSQEVYGFVQPRAQLGIETDSNEFDIVTGTSLGVNTAIRSGARDVIASLEIDLGFQNAPSAVTFGVATDI